MLGGLVEFTLVLQGNRGLTGLCDRDRPLAMWIPLWIAAADEPDSIY